MRKRAPAHRSALDRRIKAHDRQHVELKLEYQPAGGDRTSRYVVDAWLCIPSSLNVTPDSVPQAALYGDFHNYVRLTTPQLSWQELAALPDSPLVRAGEELARARAGADPSVFVYECKMLASVVRASLRDLAERAERILRPGAGLAEVARVQQQVDEALDGWSTVRARFRRHIESAHDPALPERARAALRLADEYASVSLENTARRVIVAAEHSRAVGDAAGAVSALKQRLLEAILAEEDHRRGQGYPTVIDPLSDNEGYVYRSGLLKKYCSSALFLRIRRHGARTPWQNLLFAVAAGIAMAFATIIAFWAQLRYPGVGLQLFLILVIAYMFKDRIKEGTRALFARYLERRLYDRKIVIDDPAGGTLGTCLEKLEYQPSRRLPAEAQELRRQGRDQVARVAEDELQESIVHYRKEIRLDARRLGGRRGGGGLTDIVRFHLAHLLRDMDEPDQEIEYVDLETYALGPVRAIKTYHVDLVLRFLVEGRRPNWSLVRLILDRNGIRRVERVDSARDSTSPV